MILTCTCGAKLKISDDKLTPAGIKVKCPKCGTIHLARKEPAAEQPPVPPAPEAEQAKEPAMPWFAPATSVPAPSGGQLVLVAHDSKVVADMIEGVIKEAGMRTEYAPNGLEALKMATALKPQVMIVDVGLTGIYGFELCERLKGDPETKPIKIILLSSVYGLTAYKRSPVTLYGADDYIEKHHIADSLVKKINRLLSGEPKEAPQPAAAPPVEEPAEAEAELRSYIEPLQSRKGIVQLAQPRPELPKAAKLPQGLEIPEIPSILPKTPVTLDRGVPKQPEARPAPPPMLEPEPAIEVEQPELISAPPAPADHRHADGSVDLGAAFFEHEEYSEPPKQAAVKADPEEIEKAKRFARIIVSDIALYNQEAVIEGIRGGTFYDLLKDDIDEGRALYEERVPAAVRQGDDYLQEAFEEFIASKKKLR